MTLLIIFFFLAIGFSFLCSILEAVLLSITPTYISRLEREGKATGKIFREFKKDIDKPLSAILTLNTIAHTVGAIVVGAQAGKVFGNNIIDVFGFELSYESIIAAVMTLGILIFSEIIPKTIGANNWKALAGFTASTLRFLIIILYPLVWLSKLITNLLKKNKDESVLSRSDFEAMAHEIEKSGQLEQSEYKIIKNLLNFESFTAEDIMTPKTVMLMANENRTISDFYKAQELHIFSRIPIYDKKEDNITGMILKDDLLLQLLNTDGSAPLKSIKRSVVLVRRDLQLPILFEKLMKQNRHMAVVTDDYGILLGLVTMEDVIETLFGREITDETDKVTDMQELAKKKWKERTESNTVNDLSKNSSEPVSNVKP